MSGAKKKAAGVALGALTGEEVETTEVSEAGSEETVVEGGDENLVDETTVSEESGDGADGASSDPSAPSEPAAEPEFRVAPGLSIACRVGIVDELQPFEARFCADGEAGELALAELVSLGKVVATAKA